MNTAVEVVYIHLLTPTKPRYMVSHMVVLLNYYIIDISLITGKDALLFWAFICTSDIINDLTKPT